MEYPEGCSTAMRHVAKNVATMEGRLVWFKGGFTTGTLFLDRWTCIWQYSSLRTEPLKSYWVHPKTPWWYLSQQYINRKESFFALVSILLCFLPFTPIFPKIILKCSRSSTVRCNDGMRRSSSPSFNCKRQQKPVMQSIQLRKPGEKWRPKPRKRLRGRELLRRRRGRRGQWSTSSNSGTRC